MYQSRFQTIFTNIQDRESDIFILLQEWSDIQARMCAVGKGSLLHEVREFDSANTDEQTTNRVQDVLKPHELDNVRQASNGAAAFYVWVSYYFTMWVMSCDY